MKFLEEEQAKLLGIIADDPAKYADLIDLLTGEAREIANALIRTDDKSDTGAEAAEEARAWANQSRIRSAA